MAKRLRQHARQTHGAQGTFIQISRSLSPEEKAMFHQVTGAGKAKVKREFFDLSDDEADQIEQRLGEGIDRLLAGK